QLYIDETYFDKEKGYVNVAGLKPVSRLAGDNYATLGELFTINRPR
ncbi:flavin reductase family protein, partial [Staphylococcus equorum]